MLFFALDHADALDATRFHFVSRDLLLDAYASSSKQQYKKIRRGARFDIYEYPVWVQHIADYQKTMLRRR